MTNLYKLACKNTHIATLRVHALPGARAMGRVQIGQHTIRCALGPAGIMAFKREGDGATPMGCFALLYGHFRPDQKMRPGALNMAALRRLDGWSDDRSSGQYNRAIRLPQAKSHESMWRQDDLYDVVFILDYNIRPRVVGRGSAIFFHLARPGYSPTAGCVAISHADMRRLLPRISRRTRMLITK